MHKKTQRVVVVLILTCIFILIGCDLQDTTGTITGTILLDGVEDGNSGIIVFIANTSYMAITGDEGDFTISGVPSGIEYELLIMKGGETYSLGSVTVSSGEVTSLGIIDDVTAEDFPGIISIIWKGELTEAPSDPEMNWAYYNSEDGISYIWDGSQWNILAKDGIDLEFVQPNNITNLTAQGQNGSILLNWENPSDYDFYSNEIYYKEGTQDYVLAGSTPGETFTVTKSTNGVKYAFLIVSKNNAGKVSTGVTMELGGIGPAGGYIFYDKGFYSDGWRYLEAAPSGYSTKYWGGWGTSVGGTETAIGTGESNTNKIVAAYGDAEPYKNITDYAAKLCADKVVTYNDETYDDWFLPSRYELNQMYTNLYLQGLGNLINYRYWSSSESNSTNVWALEFLNGSQFELYKRLNPINVRPIRTY